MSIRHRLLRSLGIPPEIQVSEEAERAFDHLFSAIEIRAQEEARQAVQAALQALKDENEDRSGASKPLSRLLERHVEVASRGGR